MLDTSTRKNDAPGLIVFTGCLCKVMPTLCTTRLVQGLQKTSKGERKPTEDSRSNRVKPL
jgi:hypothetical protein